MIQRSTARITNWILVLPKKIFKQKTKILEEIGLLQLNIINGVMLSQGAHISSGRWSYLVSYWMYNSQVGRKYLCWRE